MAHRVDHVFVVRPTELHQVKPAVVIVIAPETGAADAERIDAGLSADFRKCAVAVVVIELRSADAVAQENIRPAVVIIIAPGCADGRPDRL